jgi:hypothetical protein
LYGTAALRSTILQKRRPAFVWQFRVAGIDGNIAEDLSAFFQYRVESGQALRKILAKIREQNL